MKNKKIKEVIREDLPETNSSSSHSVVISMKSENNLRRENWNLNIDDNLILHIPPFNNFGRDFFCSNSPLVKIQYLSCYFIYGYYTNRVQISKLIYKFERVLKDILGIKSVSFDSAVEVWTAMKKQELSEDYDIEFPRIDWQSLDLKEEILESQETIRNFILNPDSWIYGGDDNCDEDPEFYKDTKKLPEAVGMLSVDLTGLGRVDVEFSTEDYLFEVESTILNLIVFNKLKTEFIVREDLTTFTIDNDIYYFDSIKISEDSINSVFKNYSGDTILVPGKLTIYDVCKFCI